MLNDGELKAKADAVIVGGGVIGLSVARELARRGLRVALLERGRTGAEASGAAAGMLAPQSEADRRDLFFDLLCAGRDRYPEFAASLLEETGIDIELDRTGTLYLAFSEHEAEELERRYKWQAAAGLKVERLTTDEARSFEPHISPHALLALRFPLDVQVENRRLVAALTASAEAHGVRILTGTEVTSLRVEAGRVRGVETSRGTIAADAVVVAAGAWSSLLRADDENAAHEGEAASLPVGPVRGQMLCFDARPPLVRHVVYTPRGYLVPRRDGRLLAGSTTEHTGFDKAVTADGIHIITRHALEIAPGLGQLPLLDTWAGLRPHAPDDWPVLGPDAEVSNLYYATGHYRNGILLAPLTGDLLAQIIVEEARPPLLAPFAPARFIKHYTTK